MIKLRREAAGVKPNVRLPAPSVALGAIRAFEANAGFGVWQPIYADYGIVTFPVSGKVPSVKGYRVTGKSASSKYGQLERFAAAGVGFCAGKLNGITIVDVDTTD